MKNNLLTSVDIVNGICDKTGLTPRNAKLIYDQILKSIRSSLAKEKKLVITNFGRFAVRNKQARVGRNPRTGEGAIISARSVVTFKPSETLKWHVIRGNKFSSGREQ